MNETKSKFPKAKPVTMSTERVGTHHVILHTEDHYSTDEPLFKASFREQVWNHFNFGIVLRKEVARTIDFCYCLGEDNPIFKNLSLGKDITMKEARISSNKDYTSTTGHQIWSYFCEECDSAVRSDSFECAEKHFNSLHPGIRHDKDVEYVGMYDLETLNRLAEKRNQIFKRMWN